MEQITRAGVRGEAVRVGVDLAKRVLQVHAVDAAGQVLTTRALARDKFMHWCVQLPAGCILAMETSSSSHHWARIRTVQELLGHADVATTMIYTHVLKLGGGAVRSPIDTMTCPDKWAYSDSNRLLHSGRS